MARYRVYDKVYEASSPEEARQKYFDEIRPGFIRGTLQQFGQGLSLGSADEATAGLTALTGGNYDESLRRQQNERDAFSQANPITSGIATGVGGIVPVVMSAIGGSVGGPAGTVAGAGVAGGRALQLTMNALSGRGTGAPVSTVMQGAREGARAGLPLGGIAGYASADPEADGGRTEGALMGSALGLGFGGLVGGGVQGGQQAYNAARPVLDRAASAVRRVASMPSRAPAASAPVAPAAASSSPQSMNPTAAERKMLTALQRSGVAPETAALSLERAREAGVPLGLVDVGGEATLRLGRSTRTLPGEGSTIMERALEERAAGQSGRIIRQLEEATGQATTGNSGQTVDALLEQARTTSRPFYRALRQFPAVDTPEMQSIFSTPAVQNIMREHERALAMGGRRVNPMYGDDGRMLRAPTLLDIDMVKQTLDRRLSPTFLRNAEARPQEGLDQTSRTAQDTFNILRRRLLSEADQATGGQTYAQARAAFAGPSQARDAFELGLAMPNRNTLLQDVVANTGGQSPDFYRRGVVEALRGRVEAMPDLTSQPNRVRAVYGNATDRAKLDAAALPDQVALLRQRMELENRGAQTNTFVRGGSQTADKLAEGVDDVAGDMVQRSVTNGPMAAFRAKVGDVLNNLRGQVGEQARAEVARQLTNFNNPAAQQAFLQRLSDLSRRGQLNVENVQRAAQAATISNEVR